MYVGRNNFLSNLSSAPLTILDTSAESNSFKSNSLASSVEIYLFTLRIDFRRIE